jgi:hypothetical protein
MLDLQTVYIRDLVSVSNIDLVSSDPQVIRILGEDFSSVDTVEINNIEVEFTSVSTSEILVTLPESLKRVKIRSINVFSNEITVTPTSFFRFALGSDPRLVAGEMKLLMQVIKVMMTTPGTDLGDQTLGGGFQKWPGMRVDFTNPHSLISKTTLMLNNVASQILQRQSTLNLPRDERLAWISSPLT